LQTPGSKSKLLPEFLSLQAADRARRLKEGNFKVGRGRPTESAKQPGPTKANPWLHANGEEKKERR
jgi:hypothetical protein